MSSGRAVEEELKVGELSKNPTKKLESIVDEEESNDQINYAPARIIKDQRKIYHKSVPIVNPNAEDLFV